MGITVQSFGQDCLGNPTGYRVVSMGWEYTGNPHREDGLNFMTRVHGQFIGNIYEPGSHAKARADAESLCRELNAR